MKEFKKEFYLQIVTAHNILYYKGLTKKKILPNKSLRKNTKKNSIIDSKSGEEERASKRRESEEKFLHTLKKNKIKLSSAS